MKKHVLAAAISAALLPASLLAANQLNPQAVSLINKITQGNVTVEKQFHAIDNLNGYVVKSNENGHELIVFVDKKAHYLLVGNLISADGTNLTQQYVGQYIAPKQAQQAQGTIATHTHYFTQGKNSAPHKMYVFFDPNCSACHMLIDTLQPEIQAGKVQVRFVPIGFLKPSSVGRAAHILSAGGDQGSVNLMLADEHGFNMQQEEGALAPLKETATTKKWFDQVRSNTDYFIKQGFYATPTMLYNTPKGTAGVRMGAIPPGAAMDKFLSEVGNNWK